METVDNTDASLPSLHPAHDRAMFIPRLGHMQQRLAPLLADRGVRASASPLHYMAHNPELALFASHVEPMGLALEPHGHHRQVPRGDRSAAFRALPYGNAPKAFDPEADRISDTELLALATQPLELERAAGATLLLSLSHLTGALGTRGRELDLWISRVAAAHFRRQRMDELPVHAVVQVPRELYATITVRRDALLSPGGLRRLADAYLELDVDGFWVAIEGFNERAPRAEIGAGAALLAMLREDGRPVVSAGAGQLHLGLLVNEISSSIGIAEAERFAMPASRPPDGRDFSRTRSAYHPRFLRSFRVGGPPASQAFGVSGCRCRRHPAHMAPSGREVEAHAAVVRADEAGEALDGHVLDRREWLLANAVMASHLAHDAGVEWTKAVVFEALFQGLDGDRARAAA